LETERQREITKKRVNGFLDACVTNQIVVERTIFLVRTKGPSHILTVQSRRGMRALGRQCNLRAVGPVHFRSMCTSRSSPCR